MKILLVGEFSGVHNNLKHGLVKLGHKVVIASGGDGYRGFGCDLNLKPFKRFRPVNQLFNTVYILVNFGKLIGYDVVQFITPFAFPALFSSLGLYKILFKFNGQKVYYACGGRLDSSDISRLLRYFPHDEKDEIYVSKYAHVTAKRRGKFLSSMDKIVPSMYEYYLMQRSSVKCLAPINLPITGNPSSTRGLDSMKLRIIHGVTREESKGSNLILYALEMIKENYGEQVSITIVERLPYEDYLRVLEVNDILVDQCKSYSYGMNALIAMSMGLVVLSGSEPEAMSYLGVEECPVINITPDTMQIYSALAKLIDDKQSVYDISKRSVSYVAKYHDAEKIALAFELVYQKATESNDV